MLATRLIQGWISVGAANTINSGKRWRSRRVQL